MLSDNQALERLIGHNLAALARGFSRGLLAYAVDEAVRRQTRKERNCARPECGRRFIAGHLRRKYCSAQCASVMSTRFYNRRHKRGAP